MKRWIVYAAAAVAALMITPGKITDVGKLQPVELLYVYQDAGRICVETDTGDLGRGIDLDAAMEDLKATTAGEVFLDTADFLILTKQTVSLLPELAQMLRPATEICVGRNADTKTAAQFLAAHNPKVTLKDWAAEGAHLPNLIKTEERYHLVS